MGFAGPILREDPFCQRHFRQGPDCGATRLRHERRHRYANCRARARESFNRGGRDSLTSGLNQIQHQE